MFISKQKDEEEIFVLKKGLPKGQSKYSSNMRYHIQKEYFVHLKI